MIGWYFRVGINFIITIWITKAFSIKSTARKIAKTKDNSKSQESLLILPLLPQKSSNCQVVL